MNATRARDLVGIAVVFGVVSWVLLRRLYGSLPPVHWYVPLSLAILGFAELLTALNLRARIRRRPGTRPVNPLVAARSLALAKASSLVGAAMTGLWAGLLVYVTPRLDYLAAAGGDTATAAVGVASSAALVAAALFLEYSCRTPEPPEEDKHPEDRRR